MHCPRPTWLGGSILLAVVAIAVAFAMVAPTSDTLAWDSWGSFWTSGATIKVCVDPIPDDAPAGTSAAVDAAIAVWNQAQAQFGGLTLVRDDADKANCDIHISLDPDLRNQENKPLWGRTYPKDNYDRLHNGFGKDTVRVKIRYLTPQGGGVALNANGIQGIVKHELGHAENLNHSPLSPLMQEAAFSPGLRGKRPIRPTASSLNSGGALAVPVADDLAGKKDMWGTTAKKSKSTTTGHTPTYQEGKWLYMFDVSGLLVCEPPCTDPITDFAVGISDQALSDAILTPPSGWTSELVDARVSPPEGPDEIDLDDLPGAASLAHFSASSPSEGIQPGQTKLFLISTSASPSLTCTFTGSPNWDSDKASVAGPGITVGGLAELPDVAKESGPSTGTYAAAAGGAAAAALIAVTAGAWYARRRWLG